MLAAGIPPLSVSKVTGASVKVINDIYDHLNTNVVEKIKTY
jgi:hypothetical protein